VALHHALRHEDPPAQACAQEALRLIGNDELPEVRGWSEVVLGWVEARAGAAPRGLERIATGMALQPSDGTITFRYLQTALQVEALLAAARPREALDAAEKALAHLARTASGFIEADLWRLRAESLLQDGSAEASMAEEHLLRGIEIARRQGALFWELRATSTLAQLWASQGRSEQARAALAAVYGAFREGFETVDLAEARERLLRLGV